MSTVPNLQLPGNPRYQPKSMVDIFGYDNLYVAFGEVEVASLETLGEIGVIPPEEIALLTPGLLQKIREIPTTEVDRLERGGINHDVRSWIAAAKAISPKPLQHWWHVLLTSYDPLATARTLQFSWAHDRALKPMINEIVNLLAGLAAKFAGQTQIGRTHGQHALPITVGFWLATILQRILYNAQMMDSLAAQLPGKISGAVGAFNAQVGLGIATKCGDDTFEQRVLRKLGLDPAVISTQILPPEPVAYYLHACAMLSAALGQLGRDGRNLMRSEIAELCEPLDAQGSSSTMAHKVNPINFENLEGTWFRTKNELGKVLDTLISEHQRDLVGSSVARDFPIIPINVAHQLGVLLRQNKQRVPFLARLSINPEACQRNFDMSANVILAEPLYIALQMAGYPGDAHGLVNKTLMPIAQASAGSLITAAEVRAAEDDELATALANIPAEVRQLLGRPQDYTGNSEAKTMEIVELAQDYVSA